MPIDSLKTCHAMNDKEHFLYESNRAYFHIFKYSFLYISLILFSAAFTGYFWPNLVSINNSDISVTGTAVLLFLAIASLILFFIVKDRFAYIKVNSKVIHVTSSKINRKLDWEEVRSIKLIPFIFPPLYKVSLNNDYFLFNTDDKYLFLSFGMIKDLSEMGQFITKKAKNY